MSQSQAEATSDSLSIRFARGAFWSLAGTVGSRLSIFIGAVIVARFLGQVGFGELAMIQSTIGLLGTFAGLGIGMTATKYVAELRLKDPERTGRIIALSYLVSWGAGGFLALVCVVAAPWLATKTINAPHLIPEIRLASLLLLVSAGFGPQGGVLAGCQAFRVIAQINWWQGLLSLPLTIVLVWLAGLRGVILALFFSTLLGGVLSSLALSREYRTFHIKLDFLAAWKEKAILWQFSLPSFLASTLYTPVLWAANAMLANQPNGYAELGLFNVAMQFQMMVTAVNTILILVSVPMLSELHGQNEPGRFAQTFNLNFRLSWGLAIAGGFLMVAISPWVIFLFGNKFQAAGSIIALTICIAVLFVGSSLSWQALYSSGLMWHNFGVHCLWGGILLSCCKFLVPLYGARGLAISLILAWFLRINFELIIIKNKFGQAAIKYIHRLVIYCIVLIIYAVFLNTKYYHNIYCFIPILLSLLIMILTIKEKDIYSKIIDVLRSFKEKHINIRTILITFLWVLISSTR